MSPPDFLKGECSHCHGHFEFPAEAAGEIVECPHCGQQTELAAAQPKAAGARKLIIAAVLTVLIIAAGAVAAWNHFNKSERAAALKTASVPTTNEVTASKSADEIDTNEFAISDLKLEKTAGSSLVNVTGKIRNLSDRQRFGVKLEFGLFDTNGNPVGTATDYNQVLEPRGEWTFKALVLDSKAASVKFNFAREDR
jgi:hypothetical protein